jgi:putative endonuclease
MTGKRKKIGAEGEELACRYLEERGYELEYRNFRTRSGEIDLIMRDGEWLVFIEVKTRTTALYGHGSEAVTLSKQRTIRQTALEYLRQRSGQASLSIRFDVIVLTYNRFIFEPEVLHITHAF